MIGNDIVDLHLANKESNWNRKGFLDKIYTKNEQKLILAAENPDLSVWNLWSRKEAAYKIYNRSTRIRAFNPNKFECLEVSFNENESFGIVQLDDFIFLTKTTVNADFINSIAFVDKRQKYQSEIFEIEAYSSFLKEQKIVKNQFGIPCFPNKNEFVSISHHGKYCSFIATI